MGPIDKLKLDSKNHGSRQAGLPRLARREAGVTLLLAVFIVSTLTLVAITVSVLAIQSIKNSRALVLSEPALGAAHSGAEEGVWAIKRSATIPSCNSTATKASTTVGSIWSATSICKSFGPTTVVLTANTPYNIYLYDPDDVDGDIDLSGMPDGGYHNMTVVMTTGTHNVNVYVTRFSGAPAGSPTSPVTVSPSSPRTISNLAGPSAADNRMIVKLVYCESGGCSASDTATVTVDTDAPGVPTIPTIDSTGCAQRGAGLNNDCNGTEVYSRKIQVTVP